MYKSVLVPLDGSKLAECSLAYAEELATKLKVEEVVLVNVTNRIKGFRAIDDVGEPNEERLVEEAVCSTEEKALKYLTEVGKGLREKGVKVVAEVLCGKPAEEIVIYANTSGCDLVVMSSHGRSGPAKWTRGSVAEKVFKGVNVPVMMIRAPGCVIA